LYPSNSVPHLVKRITQALQRADQIDHSDRKTAIDWFAPIVADAEAGFGGPLNVFELIKMMIEAGAAGVHLEDQLSSEKKCGHMGGKVLLPTAAAIRNLIAARLAADVCNAPTILIARTDAGGAALMTSDVDERDKEFLTGERTAEGFFRVRAGMDQAIARAISYARYADMLWFETSKPDLNEAKKFSESVHAQHPGKLLAYNCSRHLIGRPCSTAQRSPNSRRARGDGYKFQFVTVAGFHALNYSMFKLAHGYTRRGMAAYSELQDSEFAAEKDGYTAAKHQHEVGTGYFDEVAKVIAAAQSQQPRSSDQPKPSSFIEETSARTDSRLAALCAEAARDAFVEYERHFDEITRRARDRFLNREWRGSLDDARERLLLYSLILSSLTNRVSELMAERLNDRSVWIATKAAYSALIAKSSRWEIAESFFNSLTRRVFATEGVNQAIEFVDTDFDTPVELAQVIMPLSGATTTDLLFQLLTTAFPRMPGTILKVLFPQPQSDSETLTKLRLFNRSSIARGGAYIVGRAITSAASTPIAFCLLHPDESGITLDAVLIGEADLAILFSYTRAYFRVNAEHAFALVRWLRTLMQGKRLADLYNAIGYNPPR
jgi:isocitrate lyase